MKKAIACVLGLALLAGVAQADPVGDAVVEVHAEVVSNISVTPATPIVDVGDIQIGDLIGNIPFIVHANTEAVKIYVTASDLYKGDDPVNPTVPMIPLNMTAGAVIDPTGANVYGGGSNVAPFTTSATIGDFPAMQTDPIVFESKDNGLFSHDVLVTVQWILSNNEQPQGDYGGRVMLTAEVQP